MSNSERYQRGADVMNEVYGDLVPAAPEGANAFMDVMVSQVFAEVWSRDGLSIRDRRLLVMGVIAASGEPSVWGIQARAALPRRTNPPMTVQPSRRFLPRSIIVIPSNGNEKRHQIEHQQRERNEF
jgi:4-carboxymuconolactone decarboxylase